MNRLIQIGAALLLSAFAVIVAAQSVYPTRTTVYDPANSWNGYTVLSPLNTQAVIVIDMNGNVVKQWDGFVNSAGGPARVFPNGVVWWPVAWAFIEYPLALMIGASVYREA